MRKHLKYLSYVIRHRWFVMLECFKRGLVLRGITHDWSKFLPSEYFAYANHFAGGIKTGRDKTGYYKPTDTGDPAFDHAWFLHQKRHDHHWQWWCLPTEDGVKILEMSDEAREEMVSDWYGAGRAQGTPDVLAWYSKNKDKMQLHPVTRLLVERELGFVRLYPGDEYFRITKEP